MLELPCVRSSPFSPNATKEPSHKSTHFSLTNHVATTAIAPHLLSLALKNTSCLPRHPRNKTFFRIVNNHNDIQVIHTSVDCYRCRFGALRRHFCVPQGVGSQRVSSAVAKAEDTVFFCSDEYDAVCVAFAPFSLGWMLLY